MVKNPPINKEAFSWSSGLGIKQTRGWSRREGLHMGTARDSLLEGVAWT